MDRLEAMTMLVTVVELGSFSAASREMDIPLATLSRKVAELESHLGTRLLTRTTRKLNLTDAGATYLASARVILDMVESAESEASGEYQSPKGDLILTAPILFGRLHVLPIVTEFLAEYGDINIRLHLSDRTIDIIEDQVDMAIRIGPLPDSSMVATPVGHIRMVTCAHPDYFSDKPIPSHPQELLTLDCVRFDTPLPSPAWRYLDPNSGQPIELKIKPRLSVTTAEGAVDAAIAGVGVTRVLCYQAFDALKQNTLVEFLSAYEPAASPVHLIHAARGRMPLKMRKFLDFAKPKLRKTLHEIGSFQNPAH